MIDDKNTTLIEKPTLLEAAKNFFGNYIYLLINTPQSQKKLTVKYFKDNLLPVVKLIDKLNIFVSCKIKFERSFNEISKEYNIIIKINIKENIDGSGITLLYTVSREPDDKV